jgi:hypothetical protein
MDNLTKEQKTIVQAASYFMPVGAWVAGGALTSVYTGQAINDVDLYFKDKASFEDAVRGAYDDGMWCVAKTSRAVTFVYGASVVQLMHFNWFEDPRTIFDSFDFTCCMAAMDCETKEIIMHDDFLKHCSQRFLKFHAGTAFPYGTVARVLKYQKRGYTIGTNEMLRIALKCVTVPIASWDDLKEQIGGQYGEAVVINGEGDFSIDAAIAAMNGMEITSAKPEEMPSNAEALLQSIFGE